ncbi:MAG: peptidoglycan recognition family protein [Planctomycetota bacterium]
MLRLRRVLPLSLLLAGLVVWAVHLARQPEAGPEAVLPFAAIAPEVPPRAWRHIVVHHSAAEHGSSEGIDRFHHDDQGWEGIGYHFVIGNGHGMPAGRIEATFRWRLQRHGAHVRVGAYNETGIGICLIGNYNHEPPPSLLYERCAHLCALLITSYPTLTVDRILGHRDAMATDCPGDRFDLHHLRRRVEALLPRYQRQQQLSRDPGR